MATQEQAAARIGSPARAGGLRFAVICAALLALGPEASAHDPPEIDFSRRVNVQLAPDGVQVDYRLEISSFTLYGLPRLDPKIDITAIDKTRPEKSLAEAYLKRLQVLVPDQLQASLQGEPLRWHWVPGKNVPRIEYPDSIHFVMRVRAGWRLDARPRRFEIVDGNFADQPGRFVLKLEADPSLRVIDLNEPREVTGNLPRREELRSARADVAVAGPAVASQPTARPRADEPQPPAEPGGVVGQLQQGKLSALFDTSVGLVAVFLLAFAFGAAHALTPGHGKTLVAAYLIGERGTVRHAFILGLVTTLTHTGSVILIALVLWVLYPNTPPRDVQRLLGLVGGLLIAGLGLWLLLRRLAGQADHVHLFGHSHSHAHGGHEHAHSHAEGHGHVHGDLGQGGTLRLILLGVSGGIIPCWDAVILLGIAISTQQMWLGVPLLLAFSAGLASVLIAIGIAVVYAQRFGAGRWRERRWFRALPVVSALVVVGIGLWLCVESLH